MAGGLGTPARGRLPHRADPAEPADLVARAVVVDAGVTPSRVARAAVRVAVLSALVHRLPPGARTVLENLGAPRELVATWRQLRRGGAPVSLWRVARGWS